MHASHVVPCPTCGAKNGTFCVYATGEMRAPHQERLWAYVKRQAVSKTK